MRFLKNRSGKGEKTSEKSYKIRELVKMWKKLP